jgi:Uncharacterized conserved protein|nr:hypothetical protein [Xaviernesmea oryzae]
MADAIVLDGAACVSARAVELHIHPRSPDGRESLLAVDEAIYAVKHAYPGSLVGVSTGAGIERDEKQTQNCISAWAAAARLRLCQSLRAECSSDHRIAASRGCGRRSGLATVADAERFVTLGNLPSGFSHPHRDRRTGPR